MTTAAPASIIGAPTRDVPALSHIPTHGADVGTVEFIEKAAPSFTREMRFNSTDYFPVTGSVEDAVRAANQVILDAPRQHPVTAAVLEAADGSVYLRTVGAMGNLSLASMALDAEGFSRMPMHTGTKLAGVKVDVEIPEVKALVGYTHWVDLRADRAGAPEPIETLGA